MALPPALVGLAATWRLIWPWWKVPGKLVAYVALVAVLGALVGWWAVLLGWLHQALGLAVHAWFCRREGFTWYAVEDPEAYVARSKAWVGYPADRPQPTRLSPWPEGRAPQTEGEPAAIEYRMDVADRD